MPAHSAPMPMRPHDGSLNRLLVSLAGGLAASPGGTLRIHVGDSPEATAEFLAVFCAARLLRETAPERATLCDGCERGCTMEVEWISTNIIGTRGFIVCDKRDDIGRVAVETERLRAWQISMQEVASVVQAALGGTTPLTLAENGHAWRLGAMHVAGSVVQVCFCRRAEDSPLDCAISVVLELSDHDLRGAEVGLPQLIRFKDHGLVVNKEALLAALGTRLGDPRIACEIGYAGGEIVLMNHVTGQRRRLAHPDFNSANDNIFQRLFDNPGQRFSLSEIRQVAGRRGLNDLHKIAENLHFAGPLKKLFFRVSKDAISFSRTATLGQLAALDIDPNRL